MHLLHRHRWFAAAAAVTLSFAVVSAFAHPSFRLTAFADLFPLVLMLAASAAVLANIFRRPAQERSFWLPMAVGFLLWASKQTAWVYYQLVLQRRIPAPFVFDIVLFFHLVPVIAAVAWRPDLRKKPGGIRFSALNFLLLFGWWTFLYAFIVFPHQFVVPNLVLYRSYYNLLYELENGLLFLALALAALTSSGGWRRVYLNLLAATSLYGVGALLLDRAVEHHTYYSGSWYDLFFVGTVAWMASTVLQAQGWDLQPDDFRLDPRWKQLIPRLTMLPMLSLPVLGMWTAFLDDSPVRDRVFRVCAVLAAMVVLGAFVFLRQYIQDQALVRLLEESRQSYQNQKRLQNQLVQKEKLSSLGHLVAGAAHEINNPIGAVLTFAEQFWAHEHLTDEQNVLLRKIVTHAHRTRDLVANLLSFAQQSPGDKAPADLKVLLQRAAQLLESRYPGGKIRVSLNIEPDFPRVMGNANQLFQAFVEIIENAMQALQEAGGGALEISAQRQDDDAVLLFSDTGPGIREPGKVFDPFYTTKPIGKGTGLGLSAVYGTVQDHGGQITCQNKPEGGALFVLRLPALAEPAHMTAHASGH